jgi:hypothetical protein
LDVIGGEGVRWFGGLTSDSWAVFEEKIKGGSRWMELTTGVSQKSQ